MLESLKEYFSSTVNTAAQRVSNPVFGAFSLSWCAFNWKSILYLFLGDSGIIDKITYISDNSSWKTVALFPCLSVAVLCGCLPWINNLISAWQAKPLDNNDSIENHRKAKRILRETRLQRLQAKQDVTYDKVKTGAEKDIQAMKEEIIKSKDSMGELTAELTAKNEELKDANNKLQLATKTVDLLQNELSKLNSKNNELISSNEKLINTISDLKFKVGTTNPVTGEVWVGTPENLKEFNVWAEKNRVTDNVFNSETAERVYKKANSFLNNPNGNKKN